MSADVWIVPKDAVGVEIMDARGATHFGVLYLSALGGERENLQSLLSTRRFVPLRGPDGKMEMINRDHVIWVRIDLLTALDELDLEAEDAAGSRSASLHLELYDGSALDGVVRYLRPSDSQRLSDYLETVGAYFPLRTADHVYLVNRDRVLSVTPVTEVKS